MVRNSLTYTRCSYSSPDIRAWLLARVRPFGELSKVTPAKIQEWKQSFLTVTGNDPLALRKARISVNTFLRRSRSLFSRKVLRQLQLSLPSPLPFDGVEFEPRQSMKYRSEFDIIGLIRQANRELGTSDTAAYMIFLLAVTAGLRRKEIDLLEWPSLRFKDNAIRIEPTQFFHPKSQDSIGEIQMDPQIMAIFRQYQRLNRESPAHIYEPLFQSSWRFLETALKPIHKRSISFVLRPRWKDWEMDIFLNCPFLKESSPARATSFNPDPTINTLGI